MLPSLRPWAKKLTAAIRQHSHEFKLAAKREEEKIVVRQVVQARLADAAMWIHVSTCTLSRLDRQLREPHDAASSQHSPRLGADQAAAEHLMELAQEEIHACYNALYNNADASMRQAADAMLEWAHTLPDSDYVMPERSPTATTGAGTGRVPDQRGIPQFPGEGNSAPVSFERPDQLASQGTNGSNGCGEPGARIDPGSTTRTQAGAMPLPSSNGRHG